MYENYILEILAETRRPLSIGEIRSLLIDRLGKKVSYETTKRDLMALSAKGLINSKAIGGGKRVTWIFWAEGSALQFGVKRLKAFSISIEERDSLTPEEISSLYDDISREYANVLDVELGKQRFVILCDGRVVYRSNYEPTDDQVRSLEEKYGKPCYVFTRDLVEESAWSSIGSGDYYPSIEVYVGDAVWSDEEVFNKGLKVVCDFDTGNPGVSAFSSKDLNRVCHVKGLLRRGFHLSRPYDYYLVKCKVGIRDVNGSERCLKKECRAVIYWDVPMRNPYLLANPDRKGFVGRDLMILFPFRIQLSGRNKSSQLILE